MVDYSKWDGLDSDLSESDDDNNNNNNNNNGFVNAGGRSSDAGGVNPPPPSTTSCCLIFLHGSGDTGPGVREWIRRVSKFEAVLSREGVKCVYPNATPRPYTLWGGETGSVWFDRTDLSPVAGEDLEGISQSVGLVDEVIDRLWEEDGIPAERVAVCGFSQGGGLALQWAFRSRHRRSSARSQSRGGGPSIVVALSAFLANQSQVYGLADEQIAAWADAMDDEDGDGGSGDRSPPPPPRMLMCHGRSDELVSFDWGFETANRLRGLGVDVEFVPYDRLAHDLGAKELDHVAEWLLTMFAEQRARSESAAAPAPAPAVGDCSVASAMTTATISPSTAAASTAAARRRATTVTYTMEDLGRSEWRITFSGLPAGIEQTVSSRTISARGGVFELRPGALPGTVETNIISPTPAVTAGAIAERIVLRLDDPNPPGAEACTVS